MKIKVARQLKFGYHPHKHIVESICDYEILDILYQVNDDPGISYGGGKVIIPKDQWVGPEIRPGEERIFDLNEIAELMGEYSRIAEDLSFLIEGLDIQMRGTNGRFKKFDPKKAKKTKQSVLGSLLRRTEAAKKKMKELGLEF